MPNFHDIIRNKTVAVVGPAPSIIGTDQYGLIESYDVVVRLNHALPVPKKLIRHIGERTDLLYSSTKIPKSLHPNLTLVSDTIKYLVCPYGPIDPFARYMKNFKDSNKGKIPFHCPYTKEQHQAIEAKVGTRPTIGLAAIIHLLEHEIRELYITGLTFYHSTPGDEGGYYEEYKNKDDYKGKATASEVMKLVKRIGVHDMDAHVRYIKNLMKSDPRITCDLAMDHVLGRV